MSLTLTLSPPQPYLHPYTDQTTIFPPTTPPALPAIGGMVTCPLTGVQMLLVGDGAASRDGALFAGSAYSYYRAFNADMSIIGMQQDNLNGRSVFRRYDPVSHTLISPAPIQLATDGAAFELGAWSRTNPNYKYATALNGTPKIWRADFTNTRANGAQPTAAVYKDFTAAFVAQFGSIGSSHQFWQMSLAADEDVFAATVWKSPYGTANVIGVIVCRMSDASILQFYPSTTVDECQITLDGLYNVIKDGNNGSLNLMQRISDGVIVSNTNGLNDLAEVGHSDVYGPHGIAGVNSLGFNSLLTMQANDPKGTVVNLKNFGSEYRLALHVSTSANTNNAMLVSTFPGSDDASNSIAAAGGIPLANEAFLLKFDGSGIGFRVPTYNKPRQDAGTYTDWYNSLPKGTLSPDGSRYLFNTNWGVPGAPVKTFIAKVS